VRAVDLHSDIQLDLARPGGDPAAVLSRRHLPEMLAGGIAVRILCTPADDAKAAFRHVAAARAAGCRIATRASELDAEEPVYLLGLEGPEAYERDVGLVESFHWAGVRVVGLAWMYQNAVCGSCGEATPSGVTSFGRQVLARLAELGSIVDLAHVSDPGFFDAIELYPGPIMCSHASARALHAHSRNITDEQARLVAERDGIVGVCPFGDFLAADPADRTLDRFVDHVVHMVEIVGEDRVGIGPDWVDYAADLLVTMNAGATRPVDVSAGFPAELSDPSGLPVLHEALAGRGLPADKILYDNGIAFLRRALGD
jgi:membrane dipeptidase